MDSAAEWRTQKRIQRTWHKTIKMPQTEQQTELDF